jgi:hypothetical protein
MSNPIRLNKRGKFPKQPFQPLAIEIWTAFFGTAPPESDLAYWTIEPHAASVRLSARNTLVNDAGAEYEPSTPVIVLVDGIIEARRASDKSLHPKLNSDFREWVTRGILEAFASAGVAKKYSNFLPKKGSFAIVTSPAEEALTDSDLTLIWSSSKRFSLSTIATRQVAAKKKTKKARAVKKKRTSKR